MRMPVPKERLRQLLVEKAVREDRPFTLSSGGSTAFYVDAKMVTQDPEGVNLVADEFLAVLRRYRVTAVGGPVLGGVPIATAIAMRSYQVGTPIPAFFVRGTAKEHGTMKAIEGPVSERDVVAVVDDVITSGRSVLEAVERIEGEGLKVAVVIALVDRQAGAREKIEKRWPYEVIFTTEDLKSPRVHAGAR